MPKVSEFTSFSGAVDDTADEIIIRDASETATGVAKDKRMLLRHAVRQIARCAFIDESSDPGPTNDETEGYRVGNFGLNLATGEMFVCKDATEDNAVWSSTGNVNAIVEGDDAALLGSGAASEAASDGYVLTADGAGGAAWEAVPASGGGSTVTINAQTGTTYTLVIGDAGKLVTLSNDSAITLNIPANSSVDFDAGTVIAAAQLGAGAVTITGATGVTVNGTSGGSVELSGQYATASLTQLSNDTWLISGGLASE